MGSRSMPESIIFSGKLKQFSRDIAKQSASSWCYGIQWQKLSMITSEFLVAE